MIKVALGVFNQHVDLFQAFQIPHRTGKEQSEYEIHGVGKATITFLLIADEINHHIGFVVTHRHANTFVDNDTKRDCCVRGTASHFLHIRNTKDNQCPALVIFVARALILISDVVKKVSRDFKFVEEKIFIIGRGTRHLCPAVWFPFLNRAQALIDIPECSH